MSTLKRLVQMRLYYVQRLREKRKALRKNTPSGPKPSCSCGECRTCYWREWKYRKRHKLPPMPMREKQLCLTPEISDDELDRRMNEYFKEKGWN